CHPEHVDLKLPQPFLVIVVGDRPGSPDAGVVDHHVDPAEPVGDLGDGRIGRGAVGDVAPYSGVAAPGRLGDVEDGDLGPPVGQLVGDRQPGSGGTAGHDRNQLGELSCLRATGGRRGCFAHVSSSFGPSRAILPVLAVVFGIVSVVQWRREPRRLSNGLWAVLAVGFGLLAGSSLDGPLALPFGVALLLLSLAAVLSLPVATAFLLGNGVVMLRRERPTPGNLVGLGVGLGLVGLMVVIFILLLSGIPPAVVAAVWLALIASYFAFVFVCFAAFCLLYARRRRRRPVEAVVVLGSGVRDGRVSPLLAARLARAVEVRAEHQSAGWPAPVIIPSGGQGRDEIEPEGDSMARWLREHDVPADAIVVEPRARTTEENLRFSADL